VCVYCTAITLSYLLNSHFTFGSPLAFHTLALYFGIYLSAMGLGVVLLKIYRAMLPFENWVLPLLVLPFTALWNYGLSSKLLPGRHGS
jgi:putative flippase GtrA